MNEDKRTERLRARMRKAMAIGDRESNKAFDLAKTQVKPPLIKIKHWHDEIYKITQPKDS